MTACICNMHMHMHMHMHMQRLLHMQPCFVCLCSVIGLWGQLAEGLTLTRATRRTLARTVLKSSLCRDRASTYAVVLSTRDPNIPCTTVPRQVPLESCDFSPILYTFDTVVATPARVLRCVEREACGTRATTRYNKQRPLVLRACR